jgi:hypothetical protein
VIKVEQIREKRIPRVIRQVQADKRFSRYKKQGSESARDADIAEDKAMRMALRVWKSWRYMNFDYGDQLKDLEKIDYSPEDVQRFCILVKRFEEDEGYAFPRKLVAILNRMMSTSSHQGFELDLNHLEAPLVNLCENNQKDLIIRGDVGEYLGWEMKGGSILLEGQAGEGLGANMGGGSIVVNGPVGDDPGHGMKGGLIVVNGDVIWDRPWGGHGVGKEMSGGKLIINGDAHGHVMQESLRGISQDGGVGNGMSGGTIIINGYAHGDIGVRMSGGEIHLNGYYDGIPKHWISKGRIFHKGKLIVDK